MIEHVDAYPPVPESVTNLLATLGDRQRQRVLNAFLAERVWELPVAVIVERCAPLSRPAVSHHLGVMRRTGVLVQRREGKRVFYELNKGYIQRALASFSAFLDVCGTPGGAVSCQQSAREVRGGKREARSGIDGEGT